MTEAHNNILHAVAGYDDALASKQSLAATGTDMSEQKGKVENTINSLHPKRLALVTKEVIHETPTTVTLRLARQDGGKLPPFQAGQYVNLFVNINGVNTARPYAISSSPEQRSYYDLTVKQVNNGFVSGYLVNGVAEGQLFTSTGPMGTFHYNPVFHGKDMVFLAGGSGIAPAISMIRDVAKNVDGRRFHLIYSSSYENDVIFRDDVADLDAAHDWLTVSSIITRPGEGYEGLTGRLNAPFLQELIGGDTTDLPNKMYYLCGPTAFHDFCAEQLDSLKVRARRVRIECNGPPQDPAGLAGWPADVAAEKAVTVTIKGHGSFPAVAGEPLLNSMERHGFTAENACRSGECSLCRVKVLDGKVFNPPESKLRSTDEVNGWTHSCVAYPVSDVTILV